MSEYHGDGGRAFPHPSTARGAAQQALDGRETYFAAIISRVEAMNRRLADVALSANALANRVYGMEPPAVERDNAPKGIGEGVAAQLSNALDDHDDLLARLYHQIERLEPLG